MGPLGAMGVVLIIEVHHTLIARPTTGSDVAGSGSFPLALFTKEIIQCSVVHVVTNTPHWQGVSPSVHCHHLFSIIRKPATYLFGLVRACMS